MDQGFQEKWDQLKRKQSAADRAFSKNDYDAAFKFLQEAEAAADWILNQGPLRAEAAWNAARRKSGAMPLGKGVTLPDRSKNFAGHSVYYRNCELEGKAFRPQLLLRINTV